MSIAIQLAIGVGIILVALALIGWAGRRRRRTVTIHYEWSCTVGGEDWVYKAELVGEVWSVHADHGDGGLFGDIHAAQDWVVRDIANRVRAIR